MQNFTQQGDTVAVTAPYTLASGVGCLVGSLFGVSAMAYASGATAELLTRGVFNLAKVSAQAWTAGALIYWDDTAKNATNTSNSGANKLIGVALAAAANPSSTGSVRLNGAFST